MCSPSNASIRWFPLNRKKGYPQQAQIASPTALQPAMEAPKHGMHKPNCSPLPNINTKQRITIYHPYQKKSPFAIGCVLVEGTLFALVYRKSKGTTPSLLVRLNISGHLFRCLAASRPSAERGTTPVLRPIVPCISGSSGRSASGRWKSWSRRTPTPTRQRRRHASRAQARARLLRA